ncbi:hypothetical protein M0R45_032315 [Rubus argutus]|uniref:Uncharacterized protein n=1 Tax=Rubus argutus TaxID=59490 RepID=A0AAW1WHB4_RUBAR
MAFLLSRQLSSSVVDGGGMHLRPPYSRRLLSQHVPRLMGRDGHSKSPLTYDPIFPSFFAKPSQSRSHPPFPQRHPSSLLNSKRLPPPMACKRSKLEFLLCILVETSCRKTFFGADRLGGGSSPRARLGQDILQQERRGGRLSWCPRGKDFRFLRLKGQLEVIEKEAGHMFRPLTFDYLNC